MKSSSSFPVTSNIKVYCSTCEIFLQDWNDINNHSHELTFKQQPMTAKMQQNSYQCEICNLKCFNNKNLLEHKKFKHKSLDYQQQQQQSTQCSICNRECCNEKNLIEHRKYKHPTPSLHDDDDETEGQLSTSLLSNVPQLQLIDDEHQLQQIGDDETVIDHNDDYQLLQVDVHDDEDDDGKQFSPSFLSNPQQIDDEQQQLQQIVDDETVVLTADRSMMMMKDNNVLLNINVINVILYFKQYFN